MAKELTNEIKEEIVEMLKSYRGLLTDRQLEVLIKHITKEDINLSKDSEDVHHLFSLPEIKERIIEVFGEPKTDADHKLMHERIWQVHISLPKFKIDKELHVNFHKELQYKKGYKQGQIDKENELSLRPGVK